MISKQRAKLRAMSNSIDTIINIGKEGMTDSVLCHLSNALNARELIKGKVLDSAMVTPKEVGDYVSAQLDAEVVCYIGNKFVIYKKKKKCCKSKGKMTNIKDNTRKKKSDDIGYKTKKSLTKSKRFLKSKVKLIRKQSNRV